MSDVTPCWTSLSVQDGAVRRWRSDILCVRFGSSGLVLLSFLLSRIDSGLAALRLLFWLWPDRFIGGNLFVNILDSSRLAYQVLLRSVVHISFFHAKFCYLILFPQAYCMALNGIYFFLWPSIAIHSFIASIDDIATRKEVLVPIPWTYDNKLRMAL
jgi:hypothetical protein